jgi:hypothetical protein
MGRLDSEPVHTPTSCTWDLYTTSGSTTEGSARNICELSFSRSMLVVRSCALSPVVLSPVVSDDGAASSESSAVARVSCWTPLRPPPSPPPPPRRRSRRARREQRSVVVVWDCWSSVCVLAAAEATVARTRTVAAAPGVIPQPRTRRIVDDCDVFPGTAGASVGLRLLPALLSIIMLLFVSVCDLTIARGVAQGESLGEASEAKDKPVFTACVRRVGTTVGVCERDPRGGCQ